MHDLEAVNRPPTRPAQVRCAGLLVAALLALASPHLQAQLPRIPGLSPAPAAPASATASVAKPELALQRLGETAEALKTEIAQLESPGGMASGAPPGTPDAQLAERLSTLQLTANAVNQNMELLRRIESLGALRAELQVRLDTWHGLDEKAPYSIQFIDGLRVEQLRAAQRVLALEHQKKSALELAARAVEQVKSAEVALRQAQERLEFGGGAADLTWPRQMAQLRLRAARAMAGRTDAEVRLTDLRLTEARLEAELARRRFDATAGQVNFDEAELRRIRAQLDEQASAIDGDEARLLAASSQKSRALDKARAALERARGATIKGETAADAAARIKAAERQVEIARTQSTATGQRVGLISQEKDLLQLRHAIWQARHALAADRSSAALLKARAQLKRINDGIATGRDYYAQQRDEVQRRIDDIDQQLKKPDAAQEDADYLGSLRASYAALLADLDRSAEAVESAAVLSARYAEDIEGARPTTTTAERVSDGAAWLEDAALRLFNAELLAVEDTIEVNGQKISGTRSITVGKVAIAIVILIVGYYVVKLALALTMRLAVGRLKVDPNYAKLLSRWMLWFASLILIVIALVIVKIPLTVFAFLGGAVAIGLGFGTQNLIKNLISGMMILGERPFRLGDYIIVGDKAGTVTSIDLRSTTIVDVDGIETLVPNSTFIEQNVTNWTYTSSRVRFAIRVGVAYDSSVRQVTDVLRETAARHGHVLKDPAPEVLFVEFGASALDFTLHYWLDLAHSTGRVVASDLRSMILAAFDAAGIVIAFPQRDVHLDASQPIAVRVVGEAPALPNGQVAGAPYKASPHVPT